MFPWSAFGKMSSSPSFVMSTRTRSSQRSPLGCLCDLSPPEIHGIQLQTLLMEHCLRDLSTSPLLGTDTVTMFSNFFLLKINQYFPKLHTQIFITFGRMDSFTLHRQLHILSQGKSSCHVSSKIQGFFGDLYSS